MAALDTYNPTLLDLSKVLDPSGKVAPVTEILNLSTPMYEDMVVIEGNLITGHRSVTRSGIPTPTWRQMYQGVQPTKATNLPVTDNCGMLEAYSQIDKALADLNGNAVAFRANQDRAHIEGIGQEVASTIIYGNEGTEPAAFTGLAPRFNSTTAENGANIISGGSNDTDNTSIWLISWGEKSVHGIVPKGSTTGLQMHDKGQVTVTNSDGSMYEAYRTHYRHDMGLAVPDWRYIVRIANIEVSDLVKNAATGADIIDLMTQAIEMLPENMGGVRPVFYMNRTIRSYLRRQIANKVAASTLGMDNVGGKRVMFFDDIPVKRCDVILNTEALVS